MSKNPDPSPPPKRTAEDRKFFDLLKKLVRVPKGEIDALENARRKRTRSSRVKSPSKKKSNRDDG